MRVIYDWLVTLFVCYKLTFVVILSFEVKMETFTSHDNIISNKLIDDGKIEWEPLSLTLVEYPKGNTLTRHEFIIEKRYLHC